MAGTMVNLRTLVEKLPDADILGEMIGFTAGRLMELEVGVATGAGDGEKRAERRGQRDGYRERDWEPRAGAVERRTSKLRKGSYFTGFHALPAYGPDRRGQEIDSPVPSSMARVQSSPTVERVSTWLFL